MTICEQLGYNVGDLFTIRTDLPADVIRSCTGFEPGQIVTLYRLEPDNVHLFKGDNALYMLADDEPGAYVHIDLMVPVLGGVQ